MATRQIEMEVKTATGYDILHPKTDADIVGYTNTTSGATATDAQSAIDELFGNTIVASNVSVPTSAWTADSTYADYAYKANISITGCTADYVPHVMFAVTNISEGNYSPFAVTGSGIVTIWAKELPVMNMTIPTIELIK